MNQRVLLSRRQTQQRLNIGETKLNELTKSDQIKSVRIGSRRLYPEDAIAEYIETCLRAAGSSEGVAKGLQGNVAGDAA